MWESFSDSSPFINEGGLVIALEAGMGTFSIAIWGEEETAMGYIQAESNQVFGWLGGWVLFLSSFKKL